MAHWVDTYPHNIWASVILKDNKIMDWKIGQNRLNEKYIIPENSNYSYEEICYVVDTPEKHDKTFDTDAREWLKQWELHEGFKGSSPFDENRIRPGDIISGGW